MAGMITWPSSWIRSVHTVGRGAGTVQLVQTIVHLHASLGAPSGGKGRNVASQLGLGPASVLHLFQRASHLDIEIAVLDLEARQAFKGFKEEQSQARASPGTPR